MLINFFYSTYHDVVLYYFPLAAMLIKSSETCVILLMLALCLYEARSGICFGLTVSYCISPLSPVTTIYAD